MPKKRCIVKIDIVIDTVGLEAAEQHVRHLMTRVFDEHAPALREQGFQTWHFCSADSVEDAPDTDTPHTGGWAGGSGT